MDRATSPDAAVATTTLHTSPPRRRWSDGPHYPWSPATDDAWCLVTHWPALVAVLCEEVARGSGEVTGELQRLQSQGRASRAEMAGMLRSMQDLRSAGIAMQQIVRLGSGRFRASPDRIELTALARATVRERQRELQQRRAEVSFELHRAEVWIDGAVASALMNAALDWALSFSNKVRVKVEPGEGSLPARVVMRAALPTSSAMLNAETPRNRRMNDNLHWVLLRQLAVCSRLGVGRSSSAATEAAIVEFPATITLGRRRSSQ